MIEALTLASASNQVTQVSDGTDTRTFGYDAAGNVTSDTRYDGTAFAYVYDQRGRLAELKRNAVTEATYLVDARHLRVAKLSSVDSVHFLYDQDGHLLAEADAATGQVLRDYVWLGDQPLSVVTDIDTASPRIHYIHTDHLGTPKLITRDDKTVAWNPTLTPFGELASVAGTLTANLRMPGQYADAESDLHQNWHRDYDPALGRYMQADPIGLAGGTNLYGYAHANPVSYTDPTGKVVPLAPLLVGAGGAAYVAFEYGLVAADFHALLQDLFDPCRTNLEKTISTGVFALGAIAPFGGYNVALRKLGKSDLRHLDLQPDGKVHGELPSHIPNKVSDERLKELAEDLSRSIENRADEQRRLREDGPHRRRIDQERSLLRSVLRRLGR